MCVRHVVGQYPHKEFKMWILNCIPALCASDAAAEFISIFFIALETILLSFAESRSGMLLKLARVSVVSL